MPPHPGARCARGCRRVQAARHRRRAWRSPVANRPAGTVCPNWRPLKARPVRRERRSPMAHAARPAGGQSGTPGDSVTAPGLTGGPPATGPQAHPKTVLEAAEINRALTRIAHEIIERTRGAEQVVLL